MPLILLAATITPAGGVTTAVPFQEGLDFPAAFTFAPDGRVFYGELHTGEIRVLAADASTDTLWATVPGVTDETGDDGLLGIALHPSYPATPFVYVYATRMVAGVPRSQILRFEDAGGVGTNMTAIFDPGVPFGGHNRSGRILFGPDGKLYASFGDHGVPRAAQRKGDPRGKILRMNPDGTAPADNPFPGKRTFAYGVRNAYGFDFDPETGRLWDTDNGPQCNDELNRVPRGRNMGWGNHQTCAKREFKPPRNTNQDGRRPVLPERWFVTITAPTGLAFCDGCGLEEGEGRLYFGEFVTGNIRSVSLSADRRDVMSQPVVYTHNEGVISMETAPSGELYFSDADGIYRLAAA